jgi:hypothetical protein
LAEDQDAGHAAGHQDGREQPVDHRAVEQPVDVVLRIIDHDMGQDQDGEPIEEGEQGPPADR